MYQKAYLSGSDVSSDTMRRDIARQRIALPQQPVTRHAPSRAERNPDVLRSIKDQSE